MFCYNCFLILNKNSSVIALFEVNKRCCYKKLRSKQKCFFIVIFVVNSRLDDDEDLQFPLHFRDYQTAPHGRLVEDSGEDGAISRASESSHQGARFVGRESGNGFPLRASQSFHPPPKRPPTTQPLGQYQCHHCLTISLHPHQTPHLEGVSAY